MELKILKNFINHDVEVLVAGVWIEGRMTPIVEGVVTLLPLKEAAAFYGPTALKADVIQAVRQVKRQTQPFLPAEQQTELQTDPNKVRSSLDQVTPEQRFSRK